MTVASATTSGPVLSFWRLWIGAVVMGALTLVQVRSSGRRPDRVGWTWAGRCGLAFGVHQLFFMVAIKATSVVDVTLMQVLQPVFVGVLAAVVFGERPGTAFRAWSVVAIAGAAVVVLAGAGGPDGEPLGMALAAANVLFFAFYFVWSKQARDHIDTWPFLWGVSATSLVIVTITFLFTGDSPGNVTTHDIYLAIAIAALPGAIGHFVSTWPLRWVPANVPPLLQLAIPFMASALAWVILGERIELGHVIGGAVTVVGVAGAICSPAGRRLVAREEAVLATQSAE